MKHIPLKFIREDPSVGNADDASDAKESTAKLERLVADLSREREALARKLDKYHALERDLATHASREPLDEADAGNDLTELHVTEALDALAIRRLRALDHALERADRGQLEICDDCGGRIPLARLRALPGTSTCIACARGKEVH